MSQLCSRNNITTTGNVKISKIYEGRFFFCRSVRFKNAKRTEIESNLEFVAKSDPEERRNQALWEEMLPSCGVK